MSTEIKNLIFYCHPSKTSHCGFVLSEIEVFLKQSNRSYELVDLYGINYQPVLLKEEHYTSGGREISQENLFFQDKIKEANLLIFVYPLWWGAMPAILKGFFDRVLTPGFAYKYEKSIPQKLLKNKKALVFITSGSPLAYLWFTGNYPKKLIQKNILGFCGIKTRVFQWGGCRRFNINNKEKLLLVKNKINRFLGKNLKN